MVHVFPFKSLRPKVDLVEKVAELPYDVVNRHEASAFAKDNPYSYFHIDRSEIDLPGIAPYEKEVYQKAAENLATFKEKGWLIQEATPAYYLYELTLSGRKQTGLVTCTSIDDYISGKIKKHEFTRPEKELDRINHMLSCDANTSPIFLSYRQHETVKTAIDTWQKAHKPIYDFVSYHDVQHRVWLIDDPERIAFFTDQFKEVETLYIADGHHRTESAVKVGLKKRAEGQNSKESDRFLSILFPENELLIWEYNRVLTVPVPKTFFKQLEQHFTIQETTSEKPTERGSMHVYLNKAWWALTIKPESIPEDPVDQLDVSLLQKYVLADIFGIEDVRTDNRIAFVGGIRGAAELERLVDDGSCTLAFSMYPVQMSDLLKVADAGKNMPPKSTWFEPKLLSGLFLHDLETKG